MRKLPVLPAVEPGTLSVTPRSGAGSAVAHESAINHVCGSAIYIDDMPEWPHTLHVAVGGSEHASARVLSMDLQAVRAAPGVVLVLTAADVEGELDVGAVYKGDPLFAVDRVEFVGQTLFAVIADSLDNAQRAVQLARIDYEPLPAVLEVEEALRQSFFVLPTRGLLKGEPETAVAAAEYQLSGELAVAGQEHMYLEGQICYVAPEEHGGVQVFTSSQHPTEIQKLVASVIAAPLNHVCVEVRRMGGGFGGKESQAAPLACIAALAVRKTGRPVKFRMPRRDDMVMTGKRHDFLQRYQIGFDADGRIRGCVFEMLAKCGYSPDLSEGVVDRAMFHADNAYCLDHARITAYRCKTHTVSNTAFRGFGGPQGMLTIEAALDDIARAVGRDPLDVRKLNLYTAERNATPYGQTIEQHVLPELLAQLEISSDYRQRRAAITQFNRDSTLVKKGLALTPVKFGISFTSKHLNQAGALVHIYTDGTLLVNHGGTEMGQGLHTKIAQIAASEFQIDLDRVLVTATRTDKVPNTSPTAASAGTDLNGKAVEDACRRIKAALVEFAAAEFGVAAEQIQFRNNHVIAGAQSFTFAEFVQRAYRNRIPLWSSGFYQTPKVDFDWSRSRGTPFFYYANGAAVSEVAVDVLTGEYRVTRVDILHDVGNSINPAVDMGQIVGGFVQGMGWLTTEEMRWDERGRILSNSPANYKIPTAFDVPQDFRVAFFERPNNESTVYLSKAVGEPPLMLAISVWAALRDACASVADYRHSPRLDTPATPERVYWALGAAKTWMQQHVQHEEVTA